MKKILSKELILPSFWLFFFIVSPKNDVPINEVKKDNTEVKKQEASGGGNAINKNKEASFTKAVYLSGF
jgi:hypothetical protein